MTDYDKLPEDYCENGQHMWVISADSEIRCFICKKEKEKENLNNG